MSVLAFARVEINFVGDDALVVALDTDLSPVREDCYGLLSLDSGSVWTTTSLSQARETLNRMLGTRQKGASGSLRVYGGADWKAKRAAVINHLTGDVCVL